MKKLSNENDHPMTAIAETSVLEEILSQETSDRPARMSAGNNLPFCGLVLDKNDPKNQLRALIRWQADGVVFEEWLHRTAGVALEPGDTVLIQPIRNRSHPAVIGILDRPNKSDEEICQSGVLESKTAIVLTEGASIQVVAENGRPLLEVSRTESGPRLKLLCPDAVIDVPGDLSLNAKSIKLSATSGKVEVKASDDVVVVGKDIYLN
jgi:hypothetical protein